MPVRIQRKRTKGWMWPVGAVYVGRPTKWGNPFTIMEHGRYVISNYRLRMLNLHLIDPTAFEELRGKDLACWCGLCGKHKDGKPLHEVCGECSPCHADVLLEIANQDEFPHV
ncbi:MAG: DUF4326 domain-containing protein [Acidobacteriaceae bacterium]